MSPENGGTWVFVDLSVVSEAQFRQFFEAISEHLTFYSKKQPAAERLQSLPRGMEVGLAPWILAFGEEAVANSVQLPTST